MVSIHHNKPSLTIDDILDTANALTAIQNATLNNTDGAKRIQDIISALGSLDEKQKLLALSTSKLGEEDKKLIAEKMGLTLVTTGDKLATDADTASKYANLKVTNMLKVAWSKFTAFAMANPWLVAIAATIAGLTALYAVVDHFTLSFCFRICYYEWDISFSCRYGGLYVHPQAVEYFHHRGGKAAHERRCQSALRFSAHRQPDHFGSGN